MSSSAAPSNFLGYRLTLVGGRVKKAPTPKNEAIFHSEFAPGLLTLKRAAPNLGGARQEPVTLPSTFEAGLQTFKLCVWNERTQAATPHGQIASVSS